MNFAIPKDRYCVLKATGNLEDKGTKCIGIHKRNNSAPLKSYRTFADDTTASYLVTESVDEMAFMALPENIRKELVSDWKSRKNGKRRAERQELGDVNRHKQKKLTLDAFFSSNTDAHDNLKK